MQIVESKKCTGCGACSNICPHGAIKMTEDKYGFLKPVIDENKCVNCGLCTKTCPVLNYKTENYENPQVFAFINNDEQIRLKSASGAVFPAFARYVLDNNGVVFGVVYDEKMKVCHSKAESLSEIEKMQSSKYVQSDTGNIYKQAKLALDSGRMVLFTGTPCQNAGLISYLKKDYDNLLTIDLICHGTPSRKVFEMYKNEFMQEKKDSGKLLNINLRSKKNGWSIHYFTTTTTTTTRVYHVSGMKDDNFVKTFLPNLSLNDCCFNCQFNKLPRVADITMGDFWGVEDFDPSLDDRKGTSIVLLNSPKGEKYFDIIKQFARVREVPLDAAIRKNPNIYSSSKPHPQRDEFFQELINGSKTLKQLTKKYVKIYPRALRIFYKLMPKFIKTWINRYILHR